MPLSKTFSSGYCLGKYSLTLAQFDAKNMDYV